MHLIHPGRGHTDGDLVVQFVEDRAVHLGDLFFHRYYPNIDLEAGGTVQGWGDTLDVVLELEFDHVLPGHGALTDRDGILQFQHFIRQLAGIGAEAAAAGKTLEQTLADYRLVALQRALKVVGRFHYLAEIKGKPHYLAMVPAAAATAARMLETLAALPATSELLATYGKTSA